MRVATPLEQAIFLPTPRTQPKKGQNIKSLCFLEWWVRPLKLLEELSFLILMSSASAKPQPEISLFLLDNLNIYTVGNLSIPYLMLVASHLIEIRKWHLPVIKTLHLIFCITTFKDFCVLNV